MAGIRPAAVAGTFYPGDPDELRATLDAVLDLARPMPARPLALVVPHAGYVYSAPVAATAYVRLAPWADRIERVALLGPAHFVDLAGLAVPGAGFLETPLGRVHVDTASMRDLVDRGLAVSSDAPHAIEHSLEVQLPFLQRLLGEGWLCAPIAVGRCDPGLVADALDLLAPDLAVVSTDLSHYLDRDDATARDRRTAEEIVACRPEGIGPGDACGRHALRGLLEWCRRHDHRVELADLRTSADTVGDPERVVGYGAFVVT